MRDPLTHREKEFLWLLLRSPDSGDGWRSVAKALWPLVEQFTRQELIEAEHSAEGGGRMRLTERGAILCDYI